MVRTHHRLGQHLVWVLALLVPWGSLAAQVEEDSPTRVCIVQVRGRMDDYGCRSVEQRVSRALAGGFTHLVLVLDTRTDSDPHVSILAAADRIHDARKQGLQVAAWVPGHATGWGAVLALACGIIYMHPSATIGNASPTPSERPDVGTWDPTVPDRLVADLESRIEVWSDHGNLYPALLGRAMVNRNLEVFKVYTGRGDEYWTDQEVRNPPRSLRSEPRLLVASDEVLVLTTTQAEELRLCRPSRETLEGVLEQMRAGDAPRVSLTTGPVDRFARILGNTWVIILLISVGFIGLLIELKSPGFGLGGGIAVVAFALLFLGQYLTGMAEGWEVLLFVVGILLLAVELFLAPGLGLPGILGAVCILASLFLATMPGLDSWRVGDAAFNRGLGQLVAGMVIPLVAFYFIARFLPHAPLFRRLILTDTLPHEAPPRVDSTGQDLATLVGRVGVTTTMLRPAGKALVEGHLLDVVSAGELVDVGVRVTVVEVEGPKVEVRPATPEEIAAAASPPLEAEGSAADTPS